MIDVWPRLGEILRAPDLKPVNGTEQDGEKIPEGAGGMVRPMASATARQAPPAIRKRLAGAKARLLQNGNRNSAGDHEGGVEDVDGRHHTGAPVGASPSLHGGEGGDNEQAASDGEAGEVNRGPQAKTRGQDDASACQRPGRRRAERRPAEIKRENPEQDRARNGRQEDDAPMREPRGEFLNPRRRRWRKWQGRR